ncbi:MAG: hypothetical protein NVV73_18320 [Cellvibrionaceae bacterium]|nr:hypothetical protein [Cellvibrionaceae bacterium]
MTKASHSSTARTMLEGKNIHEKCKNFCIFIVFVIFIVLPDAHILLDKNSTGRFPVLWLGTPGRNIDAFICEVRVKEEQGEFDAGNFVIKAAIPYAAFLTSTR